MISKSYLVFDGFFNGGGVEVILQPIDLIANGILDLTNNSELYRQDIKYLIEAGEFNVFNLEFISSKNIETKNEIC